jgi:Raf kinase inhibitor-like YbhB/YbcL family protein
MELTSVAFEEGQEIPQRHGKKIENVSPALSWTGVPEGTRSFALSVIDRHPVARSYVHWLVADIGPDVSSLPENAAAGRMPAGSREIREYAGPFPPSGTHDYVFTIHALDVERIDLAEGASLDAFRAAVVPSTLGEAMLVGKFTRRDA